MTHAAALVDQPRRCGARRRAGTWSAGARDARASARRRGERGCSRDGSWARSGWSSDADLAIGTKQSVRARIVVGAVDQQCCDAVRGSPLRQAGRRWRARCGETSNDARQPPVARRRRARRLESTPATAARVAVQRPSAHQRARLVCWLSRRGATLRERGARHAPSRLRGNTWACYQRHAVQGWANRRTRAAVMEGRGAVQEVRVRERSTSRGRRLDKQMVEDHRGSSTWAHQLRPQRPSASRTSALRDRWRSCLHDDQHGTAIITAAAISTRGSGRQATTRHRVSGARATPCAGQSGHGGARNVMVWIQGVWGGRAMCESKAYADS
jgi:hypothetical protein